MKAKLLAAAAAGWLMWSGAAQADWDPTRWGMTPDEVRRVVPSLSATPQSDAFRSAGYGEDKTRGPSLYLYTRILRDNRTYDVRLGFAEDKLRSVEFALLNSNERQCNDARANLTRRFGTPAGGGAGEGGRFDSWNTERDQVLLIYRTDPSVRCTIFYAPKRTPDTGSQSLPRVVRAA